MSLGECAYNLLTKNRSQRPLLTLSLKYRGFRTYHGSEGTRHFLNILHFLTDLTRRSSTLYVTHIDGTTHALLSEYRLVDDK